MLDSLFFYASQFFSKTFKEFVFLLSKAHSE